MIVAMVVMMIIVMVEAMVIAMIRAMVVAMNCIVAVETQPVGSSSRAVSNENADGSSVSSFNP